jgi:hypothetical protein
VAGNIRLKINTETQRHRDTKKAATKDFLRRPSLCLCVFVSLCLSLSSLWAQSTAQISGVVTDQSGAILPGVEVTATQTDTGIARAVVTNETGLYVLANLPVGPYRLEAALSGFRTYSRTGITLQVGANPVINVVMQVGQVSETIEVQANAAMVETRNSSVGQVIESQRILELPLNGRQVTDLITLAGAAVQTVTARTQNGTDSAAISVGGGLGFGVEYTLDGANHLNFVNGYNMNMPFPDALQEFKVETNGVTAQHGSSAAVGAVTKSGANEVHGDLFEFVRNDLFNATQYFAAVDPTTGKKVLSTLKRNQFGGTIGGPITANRLFFFGGFQGTTLRQDPANRQAFVPTQAMLAGDWTAFASPACNTGRQITLRSPFSNNTINPALYSKAALNIAAKLPKTSDPCGLVTFGNRINSNQYQAVGRIDYQASTKHSVFGRYLITALRQPNPFNAFTPDNILNTTTDGYDNLPHSLTLGDTYLISPNTVQALRFAYNRANSHRIGAQYFSYCDMGIKIDCTYAKTRMGSFTVNGGFSTGNGSTVDDNRYQQHSYQLNDDVSLVRGPHQMSFGGSLTYGLHERVSHFVDGGTMRFDGSATALGMGDFLLGNLTTLTQGGSNHVYLDQYLFALYGADAWKATRKLTINYGLRWEPFLPQRMLDRGDMNFDHDRFLKGIHSSVYPNGPAGMHYPGDPGYPGRTGIYTRWAQFAPRLGFAWDVNGDGRTSVRASYTYSYNFISAQWHEDRTSSSPWGNITTIQGVSLDDPWRNYPGGSPFPLIKGAAAKFTPYGNYQSQPYDIQTPTTSSWNLSLQRQIGTDWLASASYIGSSTVHMWAQEQINPAVYMSGGPCTINGVPYNPCSSTSNTNQRRVLSLEKPQDGQLMGLVGQIDAGATTDYHGMLLSIQRRASRGVTVGGNYTWSHCIGDYADLNSEGPDQAETYTRSGNRRADRGNCNSDRRRVFNLTAVAETPQFGGALLRMLGTGWRFSGIYRWSSGVPLTIIAGSDRALNGIDNQRVNQVLADPYLDKSGRPLSQFLNPTAFTQPASGTYGNLGRGNIQGLPTWSFDMAASRLFRLGESQRIEVRAEAYNVTNSFRPSFTTTGASLLGLSLATNTFGQVRGSLDPRIMQFALKYIF